jgi:hypothetical protein
MKRNDNKMKPNETKRNKIKPNETKNETKKRNNIN